MTSPTDDAPNPDADPRHDLLRGCRSSARCTRGQHRPDGDAAGAPRGRADPRVPDPRAVATGSGRRCTGPVAPDPAPTADVPSRRALLASLVGAVTVSALPAQARIAERVAPGDTDLIALARRTATLAADFQNAVTSLVAADARFDELAPPRPTLPDGDDAGLIFSTAHLLPGGHAIQGAPFSTVRVSGTVGLGHEAEVAAWEATYVTIERRCGRRAALRKHGRTNRRLVRATAALAGSKATSREAALAKARACVGLCDPHHTCDLPEWLSELLVSTLRDVVANGP